MARCLVMMGVSGCGKTRVGSALARRLGWSFVEGDARHPPVNLARMAAGTPLTDAHRAPWLAALHREISERLGSGHSLVVACSALRRAHRAQLRGDDERIGFVHLLATPETLRRRLEARSDHFFSPALLDSQLTAFEPPAGGEAIPSIPVQGSVAATVEAVLTEVHLPAPTREAAPRPARVGLVGLGAMGRGLAGRLLECGCNLVVHDVDPARTAAAARTAPAHRLEVAPDLAALAAALPPPRVVILLVPAGTPVDAARDRLTPYLAPEDIVVDAGNSHYADTTRRADALARRHLHWVGLGVSGGPEGARAGPALMAGGALVAWTRIAPLLRDVAARAEDGTPCASWMGPGGAGHFVKTVHNAIEYAEMQIIAEAWDLLHRGYGESHGAIAAVLRAWDEGPRHSFLLKRTSRILRTRDTDGALLIDRVRDEVGDSGTGRWAVEAALRDGVAVPTLQAAVTARLLSAPTALRRRRRRAHPRSPEPAARPGALEEVGVALEAARWVAFAEGFSLLRATAHREAWPLDLATVARTWRAGCILRGAHLAPIAEAYEAHPDLPDLLLHPATTAHLAQAALAWRRVVISGAERGIPLPAITAALQLWDTLARHRQPAALLQALRDAFGRHGFERADGAPGETHHADWRSDGDRFEPE